MPRFGIRREISGIYEWTYDYEIHMNENNALFFE